MRFDPGPSPLQRLRQELGLSIPELAQLSELPEHVVLKIEQGKPVSARRIRQVYSCLVARLTAAPDSGDQSNELLLEQLLSEYFEWRERSWKLLELEVAERLARGRMSGGFR